MFGDKCVDDSADFWHFVYIQAQNNQIISNGWMKTEQRFLILSFF